MISSKDRKLTDSCSSSKALNPVMTWVKLLALRLINYNYTYMSLYYTTQCGVPDPEEVALSTEYMQNFPLYTYSRLSLQGVTRFSSLIAHQIACHYPHCALPYKSPIPNPHPRKILDSRRSVC